MGGVNEPVADRVGKRGLPDHIVPGLDGELTGDEARGELLSLDSRAAAPRLDGVARCSPREEDELEPAMGLPERGLDALGRLSAGEDEPGVARAFRKRDEVLARMGGDGHLVDPRDGLGLCCAYGSSGSSVRGPSSVGARAGAFMLTTLRIRGG